MSKTLQVRTDPSVKKKAQKILKDLGLDLSTAINMYLVQIVERQGIPFPILTENGFTEEEEQQMLKEMEWAMKYGKSYSSTKEMMDDILSE